MAVTTFTPAPIKRGRQSWQPDANDVRAAVRPLNNGEWLLLEDIALDTRKEADRYVRGWRKAISDKLADGDIRSTVFATDADGQRIDTPPEEKTDGVYWRIGIAAKNTPYPS